MCQVVRDYLPLQQGLRPDGADKTLKELIVRDYLPLQQGLRQYGCPLFGTFHTVRDYLPLQQGLRRSAPCSRSKSSLPSETIFHYNKD